MLSWSRSDARAAAASRDWILPFLIVAIGAAMFVVAARRGLDLTDEGFYLLSFRHWRTSPGTSFFGAYFDLPFRMLADSVWGIRIFGFALLLGTGTWFASEVGRTFDALAHRTSSDGLLAASIAGGATVWSYYGAFVVPYTPSYNLLTLACALAVLALALRVARAISLETHHALGPTSFALGFVCSMSIATKFSTGIILLALSGFLVVVVGADRCNARVIARVGVAVLAGLLLNVALLWFADPDLVSRFRRGIAVALVMLPRMPLAELATFAAVQLPGAALASARILLWPALLGGVLLALGARSRRRPLLTAAAIAVFVVGAMADAYVKDNRSHRLLLATMVAIVLAAARLWMRRTPGLDGARIRAFLVGATILVAPFAYSFGTNNQLLLHMGMAAIFPSVLIVSEIRAMRLDGSIPRWTFLLCLAAIAAVPTEIVVRQWLDARYTYRLGAPLADATVAVPAVAARGIDVVVSPGLARDLDAFLGLARSSGFVVGDEMIDFTGQSPGLVAVAGGVPLGAIWIVGGSTFNADAAARLVLSDVAPDDLRRAWLLTSDDSFAQVRTWASIVEGKLGPLSHERAGQIVISDPTSDDKTKTMALTLWRPRVAK